MPWAPRGCRKVDFALHKYPPTQLTAIFLRRRKWPLTADVQPLVDEGKRPRRDAGKQRGTRNPWLMRPGRTAASNASVAESPSGQPCAGRTGTVQRPV